MTRRTLVHIPDGIYSVVSTCNNNAFHFDGDAKFNLYLDHLAACKLKLHFEIYDIVCMSNHVHELYRVPTDITIAQILHRVKGHFSFKYNARFGTKDHFWRNKPFYRIVEDEEYAFHLMNYFHWNPVRAGMVDHPAKWPYSGYRFHILGERQGIIGKLLTPLPAIDPDEALLRNTPELQRDIHRILGNHRIRFIGKPLFIDHLNNNK